MLAKKTLANEKNRIYAVAIYLVKVNNKSLKQGV